MTLPEHTRQPLGPNQERWIQALESGEYKQGRFTMHDDDGGLCCLAVACESAGMKVHRRHGDWKYADDSATAPPSIVRKLALHTASGAALRGPTERSLTRLNDDGATFKEIAVIIRSDPSVYFKEPR